MNARIFVSREADESCLTLPFGFIQCLEYSAFGISQFRIVVEADSMDLPEIKMVGLKATERFIKHLHREVRPTAHGCRPWS